MDSNAFDAAVRRFAVGMSRRGVVRAIVSGGVASVGGLLGRAGSGADAAKRRGVPRRRQQIGRGVTGAEWWRPAAGITWEIQLSSTPQTLRSVAAYDVDLFETPDAKLREMEDRSIRTICYFSAGSYEEWRADAPALAPFRGSKLKGWEGEWWIDVRAPQVRSVMAARLDEAVRKGCDAVDPDNVDGYQNENGLGLTKADQLDYLRYLAEEAHRRGMAIGLKNALELVPDLVALYDFSVNEECFDFDECEALIPFVSAGKPVLQIQYGGKKQAKRLCPKANALGFSTLVKQLALGPEGIDCRA